MISLNTLRASAGLRKLANGDKIGCRGIQDKVIVNGEVRFVTDLADYKGITVRMRLDEARQLYADLSAAIKAVEEFQAPPPN